MYTQPMLEIYADDVKCNHGSTIGRLDERALFYMAQRGIPPKEANMLLQEAFLSDAIRQIQIEPLRERLKFMVEERFRRRLKGCGECELCVTK
jgi:Fe-S cluster assembly protein SufD